MMATANQLLPSFHTWVGVIEPRWRRSSISLPFEAGVQCPSETSEHTCLVGNSSSRRFHFSAWAAQHGFCCSLMFTEDKQGQIYAFVRLSRRSEERGGSVPLRVDWWCLKVHQRREEEPQFDLLSWSCGVQLSPVFPWDICSSADTWGTSQVPEPRRSHYRLTGHRSDHFDRL